jgi:hypothetical protein
MNAPPPQKPSDDRLAALIEAMHAMRKALLNASLLLQDHLYETDQVNRERANRVTDELIRQAKSN